jgi:glycosyltransferase involved in cell wall biosynthesis
MKARLLPNDEVIVVGDGKQDEARRICGFMNPRLPIRYIETPERINDFGHGPSNFAYATATGTHILRIDDDDTYVEGVFDKVRAAAQENPGKVIIFKMRAIARRLSYDLLWQSKVVGLGNVGTPMVVVPNNKAKLGTWGKWYGGDHDFIASTVKNFGGDDLVVWKEDVIAEIR